MSFLESIKAAFGQKNPTIDIPELGVSQVPVKRLGATAWLHITEKLGTDDANERCEVLAYVCQQCLRNEEGGQLISDEDMYLLTESPLLTLRLGRELLDICGLLKPKNSLGTPDSSLASGGA